MSFKLTKENLKNFIIMIISVFLMGFSLSLLVLTKFGTDPCSSMNYGISSLLHLSFGNYQLIFNLILLVFVFILRKDLIGFGTLGNMIIVGYTADFFSFIWKNICHIPNNLPMVTRVIILIPALVVFVFSAAFYMHSGQGMAPYDAVPFIISEKITNKTGKNHFRSIRFSQDFLCAFLGFLSGGSFGLMTVLMVISLGPVVQFVGNIINRD